MSHAAGRPVLDPAQVVLPSGHAMGRLPLLGAGLAVVGIVVAALTGRSDPEGLLASWLVAFCFFLSLALGCLFFVLALFATKAGWGVVIRRIPETAAATLPVFALLFVPLLAGLSRLYPWTHETDPLTEWKRPYLNEGFFTIRAVIYFAVWSAMAWFFLRASRAQDRTGDQDVTRRLQRAAGPGILLFSITVTFAAVDWLMSLAPHWYSTIFGVYYFAGCLVGAFAFVAIVAAALKGGPLRRLLGPHHLHDLGKLLFAFTCFWSYIAFSQYFLIWYANIPEETVWYAARMEGSWRTVSQVLAVGHFGLPFLFLLPVDMKQRPATLVAGASWMLLMHYLDLYWLVMPGRRPGGFSPGLSDLAALAVAGGIFLAVFGLLLRRGPVIPVGDPRLPESLTFDGA